MGENGLGIELNDWIGSDDRILGLKIDSIRSGSISDLNEYFDLGDGILEIDSVSLNTGSLRNGIKGILIRSKSLEIIICCRNFSSDAPLQIPKSNRKNIFYTATQRKKFTVRIVQRYKIEEIESLDNRLGRFF